MPLPQSTTKLRSVSLVAFVATLVFSGVLNAQEEILTWTSSKGQKIRAEFLRLTDDGVVLKVQPAGKEAEVKFSALSLDSHLQALKLGRPEEFDKPLIKFVLAPEFEVPGPKSISLARIARSPFSPDMSLQQFVDVANAEIKDGNLFVFWHMLPKRMQDDIAMMMAKQTEQSGKAPYVQTKALMANLHKIFAKQRDFVFNHSSVANDTEMKQELANLWPILDQLTASLADEELWDYDELTQAENTPDWLARMSMVLSGNLDSIVAYADHETSGMATKLLDNMQLMQVVDEQEDAGQVRFAFQIPTSLPMGGMGGPTASLASNGAPQPDEPLTYRRYKGIWLPPKFMNEMRAGLDTAMAQLDDGSDAGAAQMQMQMGLGLVVGQVATLANAKTQEEFNVVFDQIAPFLQMAMSQKDSLKDMAPAMMAGGPGGRPGPGAGRQPPKRSSGPPKGLSGLGGS